MAPDPPNSSLWHIDQLRVLRAALHSKEEEKVKELVDLQRRSEIAVGLAQTRQKKAERDVKQQIAVFERKLRNAEIKTSVWEQEVKELGRKAGLNVAEIIDKIESRISHFLERDEFPPRRLSRTSFESTKSSVGDEEGREYKHEEGREYKQHDNSPSSAPKWPLCVKSDPHQSTTKLEKEGNAEKEGNGAEKRELSFTMAEDDQNITDDISSIDTPTDKINNRQQSKINQSRMTSSHLNQIRIQSDPNPSGSTSNKTERNETGENQTKKTTNESMESNRIEDEIQNEESQDEKEKEKKKENGFRFRTISMGDDQASRPSYESFNPKFNEKLNTVCLPTSDGSENVVGSSQISSSLQEAGVLVEQMKRALIEAHQQQDVFLSGAIGYKCRICGGVLLTEEFRPHVTACCQRFRNSVPNAQTCPSLSLSYLLKSQIPDFDVPQDQTTQRNEQMEMDRLRNEMLREEMFLLKRLSVSVFVGQQSLDGHQLYVIETSWSDASIQQQERVVVEKRFKQFVNFHKTLIKEVGTSEYGGWSPTDESGVIASLVRKLMSNPAEAEIRRQLVDRYINVLFRVRATRLSSTFSEFLQLPQHWLI